MDKCLLKQLTEAKDASRLMKNISQEDKNKALLNISSALLEHIDEIIIENQKDIACAKENNMSPAMIDRLLLDCQRIQSMAQDVRKLTQLEDPIGQVIREIERPNGLHIQQVRVPIGVFAIIYESRPNVTVDIACLCLKSSNVCVLKGGKEAIHSNRILTRLMQEATKDILPYGCIHLIDNTDRLIVNELIQANDYVDVVVPRGGKGLIDFVSWIQKEKQMHLGIHMDEGLVPGTTFLYMLDDEIVGSINIRHCLNDYLKNIGGHIGYSIAPKYRRQGFATKMLQEALKFCKQWEIWPVLVTCDEDNMASKKTIEKCGGIFENKYSHEGNVTLRYWIGGEEK